MMTSSFPLTLQFPSRTCVPRPPHPPLPAALPPQPTPMKTPLSSQTVELRSKTPNQRKARAKEPQNRPGLFWKKGIRKPVVVEAVAWHFWRLPNNERKEKNRRKNRLRIHIHFYWMSEMCVVCYFYLLHYLIYFVFPSGFCRKMGWGLGNPTMTPGRCWSRRVLGKNLLPLKSRHVLLCPDSWFLLMCFES